MAKRVLFIIAQRGFGDDELRVSRDILRRRGVEIDVAAPERRVAEGAGGTRVLPSLSLDGVRVAQYEAVVIVGGPGAPAELWGRREVEQIVGGAALGRKPIAAIGLGTVLPAQAELLVDRGAACGPRSDARAELRKHRVHPVDLPVVESDTLVLTARDADAAEELSHLLADRLDLAPAAGAAAPAAPR